MKGSKPVRPLMQVKVDGLSDLAEVVEAIYGHRCSQHEAGCMTCTAWTIFDALERLVDTDFLSEQERLHPERDHSLDPRVARRTSDIPEDEGAALAAEVERIVQ